MISGVTGISVKQQLLADLKNRPQLDSSHLKKGNAHLSQKTTCWR